MSEFPLTGALKIFCNLNEPINNIQSSVTSSKPEHARFAAKLHQHVLDLGGSVAFPEHFDPDFLSGFAGLIRQQVRHGQRFVIVVGGGFTARNYQNIGRACGLKNADLDWLGIAASRLNAIFLQKLLPRISAPALFDQRARFETFGRLKVIIGCGWKPGWSTDFVACQIAADFKIPRVLVLGSSDHVYDADFEQNKTARAYPKLSWAEYQKLIPRTWRPGLRVPVDPIAARLARRRNLQAIVTKGTDLENLRAILENCAFSGTLITNN